MYDRWKDDTDAVIARSTALMHVAKRERAPAHASEVDRRRQKLAEREGFEPDSDRVASTRLILVFCMHH